MDTGKPTPRNLFSLPVQYIVPMFQRRYSWTRDYQWEPLWDDIRDTALRACSAERHGRHFLGAIVLKPLKAQPGEPASFLVVDGQQRLTTLQILLSAMRDALDSLADDADPAALHDLRTLTENSNVLRESHRHKLVPFDDADISTLTAILDGTTPPMPDHPMAACYAFFYGVVARVFHGDDATSLVPALISTVCDGIQIVSLTLDDNESEHLIFETLNARAEPLTEWEKTRNLFFAEVSAEYDKAAEESFYDRFIRSFDEREWWTQEIYTQRRTDKRVGFFLRSWLEVEHLQAIPPHRVYYWFRRLTRASDDIEDVAKSFGHYANIYELIQRRSPDDSPVEQQFRKRRRVLRFGVAMPFLMRLYGVVPSGPDRDRCIGAIESWLVRRMIAGYNARGYDRLFMRLLQMIDGVRDSSRIPDEVSRGLQNGWTWPTDDQVRSDAVSRPMYPWHAQARVRMVLEAIERHLIEESGSAVYDGPPKDVWIEHVMPRAWQEHWPFPDRPGSNAEERDRTVITLGNLSLTSAKLGIHMSNGPWNQKQNALRQHDNLFLNKDLLKHAPDSGWDEDAIRARGLRLAKYICEIWPHADAI